MRNVYACLPSLAQVLGKQTGNRVIVIQYGFVDGAAGLEIASATA